MSNSVKRGLVFPGQGSQVIGMGKDFFDNFEEAKQVFLEVDEALNKKLSDLIFSGTIEELTKTENTQPALMACSVAILRTLLKNSGKKIEDLCFVTAGHSLGEYSALVASNAISLGDAALILKIRGEAMAEAGRNSRGTMAALIGSDLTTAEKITIEASSDGENICEVANDNSIGQIVISGIESAIDKAVAIAPQYGVKKAIKLPVSGAFHSQLMQSARDKMELSLQNIKINTPVVPVIANVTAEKVTDPEAIRVLLAKQVTSMVRWTETVINMGASGIEEIVEIGSGKVLTGLGKRIDGNINHTSISTTSELDAFLNSLN